VEFFKKPIGCEYMRNFSVSQIFFSNIFCESENVGKFGGVRCCYTTTANAPCGITRDSSAAKNNGLLQQFVFPDGITYNTKNAAVLTAKATPFFEQIASLQKVFGR
jgi:hypothetical protein